jgi:hypothetical protein
LDSQSNAQDSENQSCHGEINTEPSIPIPVDNLCQTILTGSIIDSVQKELIELRKMKTELMKLREDQRLLMGFRDISNNC